MIASLGRYRLEQRIAAGGMGEVFRGVDVGWGGVERPVAVKVIAPALSQFPDFVSTFIDEARLSYLLCHANVVQVRDIGKADKNYFIAMEWVDGTDVGSMLHKLGQPLPPRYAALIVLAAACGLDYAHRVCGSDGKPLGIIHRDVSPPNILLSWEGEVKLTDFGIARWRERETQSLPGSLKGKLAYMAPEQARGEPLDLRADVFALGVVMYEMVTGKNPFSVGSTDRQMLDRVRSCTYPLPSTIAQVAPGLEAIIVRAMAARPADRHATAAALHDDLEGLARREGYSLSAPKLGAFVRHVMEAEVVDDRPRPPSLLTPVTMSGRPARPSARAVDQALGAQLAALLGGEAADEPPSTQSVAVVAASAVLPSPAVLATAATVPTPLLAPASDLAKAETKRARAVRLPPTPTGGVDVIPRSRTAAWAVLAGVAALVVVGLMLMRPPAVTAPPTKPPVKTAPAIARPATATAPSATVAPTLTVAAPIKKKTVPPKPAAAAKPSAPAHLTIAGTDGANVYVDDAFVGESPLDVDVAAGSHQIRVEGSVNGLRLVPKEETVVLSDGEHRHMRMDLQ